MEEKDRRKVKFLWCQNSWPGSTVWIAIPSTAGRVQKVDKSFAVKVERKPNNRQAKTACLNDDLNIANLAIK